MTRCHVAIRPRSIRFDRSGDRCLTLPCPADLNVTCHDSDIMSWEVARMRPLCLVCIPCFSGAAWDMSAFPDLAAFQALTPALPDALDTVAAYADWLLGQLPASQPFVLVGDSFGAAIALEAASRRPSGLRGVVASGGFAQSPLGSPFLRFFVRIGPLLPETVYSPLVVPFHARLLASRFDPEGEAGWSVSSTCDLFRSSTPARSYWARARAAEAFDLRTRLRAISVPVLLLTPEDDRLIPPLAVAPLRQIPGATEIMLPRTGHMFRYTHPGPYGRTVAQFMHDLQETSHVG